MSVRREHEPHLQTPRGASAVSSRQNIERTLRYRKVLRDQLIATDEDLVRIVEEFPKARTEEQGKANLKSYLSAVYNNNEQRVTPCAVCGEWAEVKGVTCVVPSVFAELVGDRLKNSALDAMPCLQACWAKWPPELHGMVLCDEGVHIADGMAENAQNLCVSYCDRCKPYLDKGAKAAVAENDEGDVEDTVQTDYTSIPPRSLANNLYFGAIPDELSDLTFVDKTIQDKRVSSRGSRVSVVVIIKPEYVAKIANKNDYEPFMTDAQRAAQPFQLNIVPKMPIVVEAIDDPVFPNCTQWAQFPPNSSINVQGLIVSFGPLLDSSYTDSRSCVLHVQQENSSEFQVQTCSFIFNLLTFL